MIAAYLRISTSTHNQTNDNQRKRITDAGFQVDEWFSEEGVSGSVDALERPVFSEMMTKLDKGSTVICTHLDRLGRNAVDIVNTIDAFKKMGVGVRVMQLDGVDLTSSTGLIIVHVMACMAEIEKENIRTRTIAGLERTKAEGTILGPRLRIDPITLRSLCADKLAGNTLDALAEKYGIDRNTINRNVLKHKDNLAEYEMMWNKRQDQYSRKVA